MNSPGNGCPPPPCALARGTQWMYRPDGGHVKGFLCRSSLGLFHRSDSWKSPDHPSATQHAHRHSQSPTRTDARTHRLTSQCELFTCGSPHFSSLPNHLHHYNGSRTNIDSHLLSYVTSFLLVFPCPGIVQVQVECCFSFVFLYVGFKDKWQGAAETGPPSRHFSARV